MVLVSAGMVGCNEIENIDFNQVPKHSDEYYKNLRAYKNSDHTKSFGWFGGWSAVGTSMRTRLMNLPDSVDIVSIWGGTFNLTPERIKDLHDVQSIKGTKVLFTIFAHAMTNVVPETTLRNTIENVPAYAKLLADSIYKYGYDGIDLDYEASSGDLFYTPANMTRFIQELGQYVGPKSGTDKILTVDGYVNRLEAATAEYIDYIVSQSYDAGSDSSLDGRWSGINSAFQVEQFFVTENFEETSTTGGVQYTDRNGKKMNSLMGMALGQPTSYSTEGRKKAGFGIYHVENDYTNGDGYRYLRAGIQAANPARK